MIATDCDAKHYHCTGCGHHVCSDERPSPAEHQSICDDCHILALALADWGQTA